jgi:hypothetical protein
LMVVVLSGAVWEVSSSLVEFSPSSGNCPTTISSSKLNLTLLSTVIDHFSAQ